MNKISEKKVKELIKELKELTSLKDSKRKATYWYTQKQNIVNSDNVPTDLIKEFLDLYSKLKRNCTSEPVETDDRAITNVERDEEGKIQQYTFEIYRRDNPAFIGKLDRKEMETIYRLYSIYGANLTQKIVSREFPQYTFIEFKRILRAFNIYKANSEFAPHIIEEKSEEELIILHNQNKENNVLRKIEKDQLSEANKLITKFAQENLSLKQQLKDIDSIKVDLSGFTQSDIKVNDKNELSSKSISLYLADMHIGAKCNSYTLYPNPWNKKELVRRLDVIINNLTTFGYFDEIILNLMGDSLDGMDQQTARRDHIMPQNMDNMEQVETFIEVMLPFICKLKQLCNSMKIYSVNCGNHGGIAEYIANLALKNVIEKTYPSIEFTLFKEFIGAYEFKNHTFLLCHGKDATFMKKPMPSLLDDKTKVMIYEWMENNNIKGKNVHFVKGDLHSNNLTSCNLFDYRNVLSLFGASDYSNFNYSRNAYGLSYDLFIGDIRTMGTFENM